MNHVAHLSLSGGGLILPAHTPDERELLVESVEATTKRYGRVGLEVTGRHWTVSMNDRLRPVCVSSRHRASKPPVSWLRWEPMYESGMENAKTVANPARQSG
jgi:hypothetical protein